MKRIFALALAPALLAGCVTVPPATPPTLNYAGHNCETAPNLVLAASLVPEEPEAHYMVSTPVDDLTSCLRDGALPTPYVLYEIPSTEVRMIEVGSVLEYMRIFSPHVVLLDQEGNRVRSFTPDQYLFRGGFFSVQFRPQAGERFILVTADPSRIGQSYDAIAISTSTTTIWTGYGAANWTSGHDQSVKRTFSYQGAVMAVVHSAESEGP